MRTEELVQSRQRANGPGVSPALADRVPPRWGIKDEHNKAVSLSRAGFVLHFGRTYELWIYPYAEGDPLPEIRLASRPNWVVKVSEARTVEEKGQRFVSLTFEVRRQTSLLWFYYWPREIYSTTLEIEIVTRSPAGANCCKVFCPVLARSRWILQLVLLATFGAMLFAAAELILQQGLHAIYVFFTTGEMANPWPIPWGGLVFGAILSPGIAFALNILHIITRSRELRREFCDRWPTVGA
jgi:hypothetical protein